MAPAYKSSWIRQRTSRTRCCACAVSRSRFGRVDLCGRVAASVRADPYSGVSTGLGVISGPLHGVASAAVQELFAESARLGDAAQAVGDVVRLSGRVPGFGHTLYTQQDPRYSALMTLVVEAWADDPRLKQVYRVLDVVGARRDEFPNVDLRWVPLPGWPAWRPRLARPSLRSLAPPAGWPMLSRSTTRRRCVSGRGPGTSVLANRCLLNTDDTGGISSAMQEFAMLHPGEREEPKW